MTEITRDEMKEMMAERQVEIEEHEAWMREVGLIEDEVEETPLEWWEAVGEEWERKFERA